MRIKKLIANFQRNKYNIITKYLEISLYIYSGKLMQTGQNALGITRFTGTKKDEVKNSVEYLNSKLDNGKTASKRQK